MQGEVLHQAVPALCTSGLTTVPEDAAVDQAIASPRADPAYESKDSVTLGDAHPSCPNGSEPPAIAESGGQHAQRPHTGHQGRKQGGRDRHGGTSTRPHTKKGQWTEEEELTLAQHHREVGNKWAAISKFLPQRSDNDVKNHWNSTLRSKSTQKHNTFLWLYAKEVEQVAEDEAARYRCFDSAHRTYEMLRDSQASGATTESVIVINTKPARRGVTSWSGHKLSSQVNNPQSYPTLGGGEPDTENSQSMSADQATAAIPPMSKRRSSEYALCHEREAALAAACAQGIMLRDQDAGMHVPSTMHHEYPWTNQRLMGVMASLDMPDGMCLDDALAMDLGDRPLDELDVSSFLQQPYTLPHDLQGQVHPGNRLAPSPAPSMGMVPCSSLNSLLTTDSDLLVSGSALNALGGGAGSVLLSNMDQSGSETLFVRPLNTPTPHDYQLMSHSLSSDNFTGAPQSASHPQATPSANNNNNNHRFGSADNFLSGPMVVPNDLMDVPHHQQISAQFEPGVRQVQPQQAHHQHHHQPISTPRINNSYLGDVVGAGGGGDGGFGHMDVCMGLHQHLHHHRPQAAAACDTGRGSNSPEKTGVHMEFPGHGAHIRATAHHQQQQSDLHFKPQSCPMDNDGMFMAHRVASYEQHSSQVQSLTTDRRMSLPAGLGCAGQWGGAALPEAGLELSHAELDTEANSGNGSNVDRHDTYPMTTSTCGASGQLPASFHPGGATSGVPRMVAQHSWGVSTKRGHVELEGQAWKVDGGSWCASVQQQPGRGASLDITRWEALQEGCDVTWAAQDHGSYLMPRASAPLPDTCDADEPPATRLHTSRPIRRPCTKVVSSMSLGSHTGGGVMAMTGNGGHAAGQMIDTSLMAGGGPASDCFAAPGGLSDSSGGTGNTMGGQSAAGPAPPPPRIIIHKLPTTSKWNTAVAAARGWPTGPSQKRSQRNQGHQSHNPYRAVRSQPGMSTGGDGDHLL